MAMRKAKTGILMIKTTQKRCDGTRARSGILTGFECVLTAKQTAGRLVAHHTEQGQGAAQGACGICDGIPNCLRSSCVTPSVRMVFSAPMGLSIFKRAVRRMVMIRDTFFLPCSHLFPNMIFLKITELRKPCSDLLFVGSISGYLRNVKSSFLCVMSRLRIVSDSLCETGFEYSFLNLRRMSFLSERQRSGDMEGYRL